MVAELKQHTRLRTRLAHAVGCVLLLMLAASDASAADFARPEPVRIEGYDDHAMEPFLTRDGRVLLFNNSNDQ